MDWIIPMLAIASFLWLTYFFHFTQQKKKKTQLLQSIAVYLWSSRLPHILVPNSSPKAIKASWHHHLSNEHQQYLSYKALQGVLSYSHYIFFTSHIPPKNSYMLFSLSKRGLCRNVHPSPLQQLWYNHVEIAIADQHQQVWGTLTFKVKEVGNPVGKHSTLTASHAVSQKLFWILAKGFTSFWPTATNPYTRVCATEGAWINTYGDWKVDYSKQNEGQTGEISGTFASVPQNLFIAPFWQACSIVPLLLLTF